MPAIDKAETVFNIALSVQIKPTLAQATSFPQATAVGQIFDPTTLVEVEDLVAGLTQLRENAATLLLLVSRQKAD